MNDLLKKIRESQQFLAVVSSKLEAERREHVEAIRQIDEILQLGKRKNKPRCRGIGKAILAWVETHPWSNPQQISLALKEFPEEVTKSNIPNQVSTGKLIKDHMGRLALAGTPALGAGPVPGNKPPPNATRNVGAAAAVNVYLAEHPWSTVAEIQNALRHLKRNTISHAVRNRAAEGRLMTDASVPRRFALPGTAYPAEAAE